MSFEDLVQLLIIGGAIVAWLLGGATKSKRAPPPQQPRPRPRAQRRPAPEAPTRVVVRPRPPERSPAESMAEEIYRILGGEVAQREREETLEVILEESAPSRESLEEIPEAEAYSLETLEPAGEASHRRFHDKYVAQPPRPAAAPAPAAQPESPRRALRRRPALGAATLRDAILWHEILGPPKAFKD